MKKIYNPDDKRLTVRIAPETWEDLLRLQSKMVQAHPGQQAISPTALASMALTYGVRDLLDKS